jgi:preprotein translocase subunit SecF
VEIIKPGTRFDFVGKRRAAYAVSVILIVLSFAAMLKPGLRFGVEFRGGWEIELTLGKPLSIQQLRSAIAGSAADALAGAEIQQLGDREEGTYLIRGAGEVEKGSIVTDLEQVLERFGNLEVRRFEAVGGRVGSDLLRRAVLSLVVALAGILGYVSLRFNWQFAPGAVLALLHDVIVATGIIVALERELTLPVLAALLALIGFSTNDTIVIYDRIRENLKRKRRPDLATLVNLSLNEILGRTILTSGALLVASLSLLVFGGPVLRDFALTLTVGILAGTYSSIFVAGAVTLEIKNRWPGPRF